jgi:hypothetical protein
MSYILGSGWWVIWYALLWLALTPFIVMTATLVRATPDEPMLAMETAFAIGAMGVMVLMAATAISGYLWSAGRVGAGVWPYVRNIAGAALAAFIIGLVFVFGASYYAVTPKLPMVNRWAAQIICLGSAGLMLAFCLHATWRFRHR